MLPSHPEGLDQDMYCSVIAHTKLGNRAQTSSYNCIRRETNGALGMFKS